MSRSTYMLTLVALILGSYIVFFDSKQKSTDERKIISKKLFDFNSDTVDRIIRTQNQQSVVIVKKDGKWWIEKPVEYQADNTLVRTMLGEIEFSEARRIIEYGEIANPVESLKEWGLATPAVRVEVFAAGKKCELLLGRKTAVSEMFYARTSADKNAPVYLVPASLRDAVDKKIDDLRSKTVVPFKPDEVRLVDVRESVGDGIVQAQKESEIVEKDSKWSMQKPMAARCNSQNIGKWIASFTGLKISRFISDDGCDPSTYGLDAPVFQFKMAGQNEGSNEFTLLVGKSAPANAGEIYAKRMQSPTVFTINEKQVRDLVDGVAGWRDRKVVSFNPADVNVVSIESGKARPVVFKRNESGWYYGAGADEKADVVKVSGFIMKLAGLDAVAFVKDTTADLKIYGLDKPQKKIVLSEAGVRAHEKIEVLFGKVEKGQLYVKNSAEPFIYAANPAFLSEMPKDVQDWRSLRVLDFPKADVSRVVITSKAGAGTIINIEKRDGKVEYLLDGSRDQIDAARFDAQLSLLSQLRAEKWLGAVPQIKDFALKISITCGGKDITFKVSDLMHGGARVACVEVPGQPAQFFELSISDFNVLDRCPTVEK